MTSSRRRNGVLEVAFVSNLLMTIASGENGHLRANRRGYVEVCAPTPRTFERTPFTRHCPAISTHVFLSHRDRKATSNKKMLLALVRPLNALFGELREG